jgi:hypothetical protein
MYLPVRHALLVTLDGQWNSFTQDQGQLVPVVELYREHREFSALRSGKFTSLEKSIGEPINWVVVREVVFKRPVIQGVRELHLCTLSARMECSEDPIIDSDASKAQEKVEGHGSGT